MPIVTKEYILSEIRRTAIGNGGKPLGRERFLAETGVRESDWTGKYWIRWSDAVTEAGFTPNRLTERLPDAEILGRLAELVDELGHFPRVAELRFKARSDGSFPSHNTFRRFGDVNALAVRLREYCKQNELLTTAELCQRHIGTTQVDAESEPSSSPVLGSVYLLRSSRFYKIGRTNAVGRRERELAIQLPERAVLVHSIRTDDPAGIEAYWHNRFSDKRKNGEWFALTAADVSAFRRRRFM